MIYITISKGSDPNGTYLSTFSRFYEYTSAAIVSAMILVIFLNSDAKKDFFALGMGLSAGLMSVGGGLLINSLFASKKRPRIDNTSINEQEKCPKNQKHWFI